MLRQLAAKTRWYGWGRNLRTICSTKRRRVAMLQAVGTCCCPPRSRGCALQWGTDRRRRRCTCRPAASRRIACGGSCPEAAISAEFDAWVVKRAAAGRSGGVRRLIEASRARIDGIVLMLRSLGRCAQRQDGFQLAVTEAWKRTAAVVFNPDHGDLDVFISQRAVIGRHHVRGGPLR